MKALTRASINHKTEKLEQAKVSPREMAMVLLMEETDLKKSKLGSIETSETNVEEIKQMPIPEVVVNISKEAKQEPEKAQPKEVRSQFNSLRVEAREEQIDSGSKPSLKPTLTSEQTTLATSTDTFQRSTPGTTTTPWTT